MKWHALGLCALGCCSLLTLPSIAQNNAQGSPWNGSWKADPSSLKYDGATFSIATDANGFTVTRGTEKEPAVVCDGKPNPPHNGMVTTCTKSGDMYQLQASRNGKVVDNMKFGPSADGKTLERTINVTPSEGSPYVITTRSKRLSGGPGISGVWKEAGFTESQDTGILSIKVDGNNIAFKETDVDSPVTCKLDGTPTTIGPRTVSIKHDGPHVLKVIYRGSDGKVQRENTFVLSPDGKTIHETDITPAPSPSRLTLVLHKS